VFEFDGAARASGECLQGLIALRLHEPLAAQFHIAHGEIVSDDEVDFIGAPVLSSSIF